MTIIVIIYPEECIYQIFSSQKNFCKKVVIAAMGMLPNMKLKCDLLHQKN